MSNRVRDNLEAMLARGQDNALLRFSLGSLCLEGGEHERAAEHLRHAVGHDPGYSAAWKLLGKALVGGERPAAAAEAWRRGIEVAEARGDKQAAREMGVFLRRLQRSEAAGDDP
jgi:Tfp pilus assembly protein PilF